MAILHLCCRVFSLVLGTWTAQSIHWQRANGKRAGSNMAPLHPPSLPPSDSKEDAGSQVSIRPARAAHYQPSLTCDDVGRHPALQSCCLIYKSTKDWTSTSVMRCRGPTEHGDSSTPIISNYGPQVHSV
jgi:hypothetical protein